MKHRPPTSPPCLTSTTPSASLFLILIALLTHLTTAQQTLTSIVTEVISVPAASSPEPISTVTQTTTAAAPTMPLSPTYTDPTLLRLTTLNTTNYFRYLHSAPFLSYNTTLASFAQSYSSNCIWAHNPTLSQHNYGENLARGYPNLTSAVDAWYDEVWQFDYDFDKSDPTGFTEETGHFTQLVWRDTQMVGCGWTDCQGRNGVEGVLVVCNYWPAGNVLQSGGGDGGKALFVQNVLPERQGGDQGWGSVQEDAENGVRNETADGGQGQGNGVGVHGVVGRWTLVAILGLAVVFAGSV